jgi:hypothetical protein
MPIDKSAHWGEELPLQDSTGETLLRFRDERALSTVLTTSGPSEVRLTGGEFVVLTGGQATEASGPSRRYPCDALEIRGLDSGVWTIGTIELRRRRWRLFGGFVVLSNLGASGGERYSARAHPNDGKFEVVEALDGLSWRERLVLSRRFTTGADFSHPHIRQKQVTAYRSQAPLHVFVDGSYHGKRAVEIEIRADFLWIQV